MMTRPTKRAVDLALILLVIGCESTRSNASTRTSPESLSAVSADDLLVTEGAITERSNGTIGIDSPKVRGVAKAPAQPRTGTSIAELRFTYLGPTAVEARLASGALRRQIGLKLRAQDSCNLIYVTWRSDAAKGSAVVVQVKKNAGKRLHRECGARGYRTVRPSSSLPVAPFAANEPHVLRAELSGEDLVVRADGTVVWRGRLGTDTLSFDGPSGIRSDNGRFDLELFVSKP
jgi:hypothetical protein